MHGRQLGRPRERVVRRSRSATRATGCDPGRRATGSSRSRSVAAGRRRRRRPRSAPRSGPGGRRGARPATPRRRRARRTGRSRSRPVRSAEADVLVRRRSRRACGTSRRSRRTSCGIAVVVVTTVARSKTSVGTSPTRSPETKRQTRSWPSASPRSAASVRVCLFVNATTATRSCCRGRPLLRRAVSGCTTCRRRRQPSAGAARTARLR